MGPIQNGWKGWVLPTGHGLGEWWILYSWRSTRMVGRVPVSLGYCLTQYAWGGWVGFETRMVGAYPECKTLSEVAHPAAEVQNTGVVQLETKSGGTICETFRERNAFWPRNEERFSASKVQYNSWKMVCVFSCTFEYSGQIVYLTLAFLFHWTHCCLY